MAAEDLVVGALAALPPDAPLAVLRDGRRWLIGIAPEVVLDVNGPDAFTALDRVRDGWWSAVLSYDLGRAVERITPRAADPEIDEADPVPDLRLARFDARLVIDADTGALAVDGDGESRSMLLTAARHARAGETQTSPPLGLGDWSCTLDRDGFADRVRTIIDLLRAGDCYQVNLTRRLTSDHAVDPVTLFGALIRHNPAPHAALLRFDDLSVVSASPERFLRRDGDRVETRPIKGTDRDASLLAASAKDRAENVMIVDLARNDLGRVCAFGTITVPRLCEIEAHPGLHHLVSTVRGTLRPGTGLGALARATFPPASVTGAPKPRVLQIIEDLEPVRRSVYCGAVGWVDGDRQVADLNVAIRTFTIAAGRTHLGVGAGIVADSDPEREWDETELKVARLRAIAGAQVEVA